MRGPLDDEKAALVIVGAVLGLAAVVMLAALLWMIV